MVILEVFQTLICLTFLVFVVVDFYNNYPDNFIKRLYLRTLAPIIRTIKATKGRNK